MRYRRELDGLRAVAVLPVIFFHAGFEVVKGGFLGVDVFFVISGFLVTSLLLRELETGQFSAFQFYERRARRILPALYVVLLACFPFGWIFLFPNEFKDFSLSSASAVLFVSNFWFWNGEGYFAPSAEVTPLIHTWSLSLEEQFYFLLPIFLYSAWRFGRRKAFWTTTILFIASYGLCNWAWSQDPATTFYLLPTRLWELLAGSLCAFLAHVGQAKDKAFLGLLGLALIVGSVFFFDQSSGSPSTYAAFPVLGTCLVILYSGPNSRSTRILSNSVLVAIGLVSYSAYLWHQPIFAYARIASIGEPSRWLMSLLAIFALGLAAITWKYVEQPFRNRSAYYQVSLRALLFTTTISASVLLAFSAFVTKSAGLPNRFNAELQSAINASGFSKDRLICMPDYRKFDLESALKQCTSGSIGDQLVVLLGDSHAEHYAFALHQGAIPNKIRFVQLTVSSCLPHRSLVAKGRDCGNYAIAVEEYLKKNKPDLIILSARWTLHLSATRFDNGEGGKEAGGFDAFAVDSFKPKSSEYRSALFSVFEEVVEQMRALGQATLLIYPSPEAGWHVPRHFANQFRFRFREEPIQELSTDFNRFLMRNAATIQLLDTIEGSDVFRFRPDKVLCGTHVADRCLNTAEGQILYSDDNHFSHFGSLFLQKELFKEIERALGNR